MREKGATDFDKLCHKVFDTSRKNYRARENGVSCRCGHALEVYYCEEGLFLVECVDCKTKALVMARNSKEAACKTFAFGVGPWPLPDDRELGE